MNKKGAETITVIIALVLGAIVLVALAWGFGTGWGNAWNTITGYFSSVNVDSVKSACNYACSTKASYDYCVRTRDVVIQGADGKKDAATFKGKTCTQLELANLGFEKCNIDCGTTKVSCTSLEGEWMIRCDDNTQKNAVDKINNFEDRTDTSLVMCCAPKTCADIKGVWKVACDPTETDKAYQLISGKDKADNSGKQCCVK